MTPTMFRPKPVEIEAMQWTGDADSADQLWEWTRFVVSRTDDGRAHMVATDFMVLGEDDAYEVFGCYDEDGELRADNAVDRLRATGCTAVIRDREHGTWVGLATNDWIIKDTAGLFTRVEEVAFAETYEAAASTVTVGQRVTTDLVPAETRTDNIGTVTEISYRIALDRGGSKLIVDSAEHSPHGPWLTILVP